MIRLSTDFEIQVIGRSKDLGHEGFGCQLV